MTYTNLDGTTPDKSLGDLLKWKIGDRLTGKTRRDDTHFVTPVRANDGVLLASSAASATWIGHATFALRLSGKMIVTDPIWSERVGPAKRLAPPGIALAKMPRIDVVTISHSHYDHLDVPTLKRIGPEVLYVVPKDVGEILRDAGLPRVVELDWWESCNHETLKITLVPAQHWSMRMPWDRNKRLWGGFIIAGEEGRAYHAGDTAFSERVFSEIAARENREKPIDWALIPIGAYDPRWFMASQHIGPEDAVTAFDILGARQFFAMHWGTFKLTDEPIGEPPEILRARWAETGHDPSRLNILDIGETRAL